MINPDVVPWTYVDRWECVRCGWCCRNLDVSITIYDEIRLRKYGDIFRKGKVGLYLKRINGACVFYDGKNCRIYDERPRACIFYPFYILKRGEEIARFGRYYVYVDKNCRGMGKGRDVREVITELIRIKEGARTGTRTRDDRIHSPALYP